MKNETSLPYDAPGTADGASEKAARAAPGASERRAVERRVAALYRANAGELCAALRKNFGEGPPDPDDITQQAFEKLLRRRDLSDVNNIKAFLWRTARNLLFKEQRARKVRARHDFEIEQLYFPLEGDTLTPERVIAAKEQLGAIDEALRAMPEKRRRAFVLYRIERLAISDIARRLGIGRTAVYKHIARAAADIDKCLDNRK